MKRTNFRKAFVVTTAAVVFSGCTTQSSVTSRIDSSGLTIVTLGNAIVLSRNVHHLAASARDYAYVGPVEINRMGKRDHYLWLGLASTIDRAFVSKVPSGAVTLALLVDGQPMTLPLSQWYVDLDGAPYETIAPLYASMGARASLNQIQRIAAATSVEVLVVTNDATVAHYRMWQGDWPSWSLFGNAE